MTNDGKRLVIDTVVNGFDESDKKEIAAAYSIPLNRVEVVCCETRAEIEAIQAEIEAEASRRGLVPRE